ncbi:MarR family winged helix-turn-helix transcriptional regulator [Mesorhizobium sp. INR15]|uniref:MarR family winged helix-turn-helix transcriptional regulator n=1 Tax=Mesorhizobium sp. INR15 TaxID=2654248 RepID=UPI00189656E0|nr:helix-turn-helix domain-containing protein [Mesorhizobium sp. INR15]QPC92969.1 MarR family transcriptional regulator [Mesorhizobium sp. INR15]
MSDRSDPQKRRATIGQADYQRLSEFRYLIRCFLEFSQVQAEDAGLTARQHQALLAIKGFPGGGPVTIGDLAERLRIRHHSTVELVNRLCEAGLVVRDQDKADHRRVLLQLTERADDCLAELSATHLDELSRIEPMLRSVLARKAGHELPK